MFRSNTKKPERIDFNIAINQGGLGDLIASLPILKFIIDNYSKNHKFHFWVPDYSKELVKYCFPNEKIYKLSEKEKFNDRLPTFYTAVEVPTFLRQHLTDYASLLLCDTLLKPEEKNYIKPDVSNHNLSPEVQELVRDVDLNKVIFITSMYTSEVRTFRASAINKIVKYIIKKGFIPIFIGKENTTHFEKQSNFIKGKTEDVDFTKGINLINKTTILDLLYLFNRGKMILGLDNGLLHLACMTDIFVIGGFTTVLPEHRLPYRHNILGWNYASVTPHVSLECRFCQSNWPYEVKQDFTKCFYLEEGLDNTIRCCDQITADKFINIMKGKLNES